LDDLLLRYVTPLKVRHGQLSIERSDVDSLFSYIEPIIDLHHKINEHLHQHCTPALTALQHTTAATTTTPQATEQVDGSSLSSLVGHVADCFLSYHAYLKMYVQYVNQYNSSMETLKRLSEGRKFVKFLAQTHRPPILDLPSYLIMPVQRIPRYEMFLSSLVKLCDSASFPSYPRLCAALLHIQSIAALINESKRAAENGVRMVELKKRIKGFPSSTPLLVPHRKWLREDSVVQLAPKRRDYILVTFNDALLLLSQAWRVKGFYQLDELQSIRHYDPKATHAQLVAHEQQREGGGHGDGGAEEHDQTDDDDGDDGVYATSVEIELKKGRDREGSGAGGGGAGGGGGVGGGDARAGLKLKRFSLAFTAAVAAMTDQHTIELQFNGEGDKAAWAQQLHRAHGSGGGAAEEEEEKKGGEHRAVDDGEDDMGALTARRPAAENAALYTVAPDRRADEGMEEGDRGEAEEGVEDEAERVALNDLR